MLVGSVARRAIGRGSARDRMMDVMVPIVNYGATIKTSKNKSALSQKGKSANRAVANINARMRMNGQTKNGMEKLNPLTLTCSSTIGHASIFQTEKP